MAYNHKIKSLTRLLIISIVLFATITYPSLALSQSLTITDLTNLQSSNLEKVTGFFSFKGWTWQSTQKNLNTFNKDGYQIVTDRVIWKNGNEEFQLLQSEGYQNIIFYYVNVDGYNNLKNEITKQAKYLKSATLDNQLSHVYEKGNVEFSFNERKVTEWFSNKFIYEIAVFNSINLDRKISSICGYCKGHGEVLDFEKCYSCNGSGKKNCNSCSGKGKTLCGNFCAQGKKSCSKCWGQGDNQCSRCYGQGKFTNCQSCNGSGKVNKDIFIGNTRVGNTFQPCTTCNGRGSGEFACNQCSGKGRINCNGCMGTGTTNCPVCKGEYQFDCKLCNGKGYSDLACSNCSGKGITNQKVKKVCPICEGTKLK